MDYWGAKRGVVAVCASLLIWGLLPVVGAQSAGSPSSPETAATSEANLENELEVLPELITFVEATYPARALRQGLEGSVFLDLLVNESGRVDSVFVARGIDPSLDAAASEAAHGFVFSPAQAGGEPVPVFLTYEYTFSIREAARRIPAQVNFSGTLREKGTRHCVADALVAVAFPDLVADSSLSLPWTHYLNRLGEMEGQFLEEQNLVTYTDSTGYFEFRSLPSGRLEIRFPNPGYQAMTHTETLGPEEHLAVDYWIESADYNEYEIVVYGQLEKKEVTRQRLTLTEIEKIPGFGGDAIRVVQALPGVARPSFGSAEIIVRGSGQEDTRYFLDGIEIPYIFHFGGLKSTYNSQALTSVDLYPGGFNSRYGGCIGGVIEVNSRAPREDRWLRTIDVNLLDATAFMEGPLNRKWSMLLTGRRSYIGQVIGLAKGLLRHVDLAVAPYYYDGIARVDYRPNRDQHAYLTFLAVKDRLEFLFEDENVGSSEVSAAKNELSLTNQFQRLILGYEATLTEELANQLTLAIGRDSYMGQFFGAARYDFNMEAYQVRNQLSWSQNRQVSYNLGLDYQLYPLKYEVHVAGAGHSVQKRNFSDAGLYANVEFQPNERTRLIPGFRYDHYTEISQGQAGYRLTSHYELTPDLRLKAAVGTYNQSPRPLGQAIDPEFGNPNLPLTSANHYTVGTEWQVNDLVSAAVDLYYNTQDDIPMQTDSLNVNFLPDMDARMYGIEFMLRHAQGKRFFGWLSYSLARSERRSPYKPFSSISGEWDPDAWILSEHDQTHHIQIVGSYKLGRDWSIGSRIRYVTGNPTSSRLGYTSNTYEFDADTGEYISLVGGFRADRVDPFFQIDFRVDKRWVFTTWMLNAYLDVQNLNYFVYNSPETYIYNYDDSERKTIGSIFLPTIGFRAQF